MDLSQKIVEVCEELSKLGIELEPVSVTSGYLFQKEKEIEHYGFIPKKKFQLFHKNPIFKLNDRYDKIILTSFSRDYDDLIEEIAKRNNFAYTFEEPPVNVFFH